MPDFENPAAFWLFMLIPAFFLLRKSGFFSRPAFYLTLSDWGGKTFDFAQGKHRFFIFLSTICLCFGYICAVLALAKPVFYKQERVYTSRGSDILFVIDVSPSMAAMDIGGVRRIDAAKQTVRDLVLENSGASFGIVAMAKEASVIVPQTMDHSLFLERLDSIQIGFLGDGTALGTGLCTAVYHLLSSSASKKCIVLVTDGENNSGAIHPETASTLAAKNNITVYALGVGTSGTVPIDYVDPKTGKNYSGFLNSSFDSASLRQISLLGGGRYFEVLSIDDLSLALSVISRSENTVQTYHSKTTGVDFSEKIILLAGLFVVISWIFKRCFLREII
ncbi:MAG: VWA domain-containing protein [Treponema sp.]|nr:VWA domain-containing protein [Treponema sp.]